MSRHVVPAMALLALAGAALAQDTFRFQITPATSTINAMFSAEAPATGSFIGNYDAQSNPSGTRTLLGAFGLCNPGNQTVTYTGSGGASGKPTTNPTGTFTLRIDTVNDRAVLYALDIDLLGGAEPAVATSAQITYQAFRTCNPTGFFPSLAIPLELGDAVITRMNATMRCAPAVGVIKMINPGEYTFSVPTTIIVDPGVTFNDVEQETAPIEVPVTLVGTALLGDVAASADARLQVDFSQTVKGPIDIFDAEPFDLPNPLGGTAHLLLDLTLTQLEFSLNAAAEINAAGMVTGTPCLADWNRDDTVNSQDFFDFLTGFFSNNADFNCSGTTDSQDYFDFLTAFFTGC